MNALPPSEPSSSSFDYMRAPDDVVIPRRTCKRYLGKAIVTLGISAGNAGCIYARIKDYSPSASTGAMLGTGFLSGLMMKELLTDRTFTTINSFICRWGFEIFQFLTQFNLNRQDLQKWLDFDQDLIKKTTLALIAIQAGHAVFSETLFELTSPSPLIPRRTSREFILPIGTNKLLGLPRDNKGLLITQATKIAIAISLIAIGVFACENAPNANFVCINGGTYLGTHAIGMTMIQKYLDYWKVIRNQHLEMTLPDPPGRYHYRRENFDGSVVRRTSRRAVCCFRTLKLLERTFKVLSKPLIGLILYATNERTKRLHIISSAMIGLAGGGADASIRSDFENGWTPYENQVSETRVGSWRQKVSEGIREHCSDPSNIIKDILLAGTIAWFAYGISTLDDTAPKVGIILFLSSLFVGYGVTKIVDSKFRYLESPPLLNSLYYHLLQNPDYLLFFFAYLKSLSGKMGKSAYNSFNNSLIADLGWISLGLAAGNNRALQNSSQPRARTAVPIAKTLFALVIFEMILDQLA